MNRTLYQIALFVGSLSLMSISSFVLTVSLERIGARLKFAEGLLGILTALGADAPEISSSITALSGGHHDLGIGVVLGSNIFNLAILLGLSAVVAGRVRVGDAGVIFNGAVAILITLVIALLLFGRLPAWLSLTIACAIMIPYVFVLALHPSTLSHLPLPRWVRTFLSNALEHPHNTANKQVNVESPGRRPKRARYIDWLSLLPALFAIVAGSRGIVSATISLSSTFSIPVSLAGIGIIAALTGIPNAIAAIRLALHCRGSAVETECFNSNAINALFGICLPAVIIGLGPVSTRIVFALIWFAAMTILSLLLLFSRDGMRRSGGSILIACYLVFVLAIIFWPQLINLVS